MYRKPNRKIIEQYLNIYRNYSLQECMIGLQPECRIYNKDSYMCCITDPEVFLEYVIYPLYIDEGSCILDLMMQKMDFLISSSNPIEYFQAINYLCGEKMLKKIYGELPFYMFDENRINLLHSRLTDMKDKMESYRDGDFGKYMETMYDMASRILKSCTNN